ncbi:MAG TPA: hypothetical protein VHW01_25955 [Polyangiaceae bacterium]|nr:hypothetical protein [Polyangiaceae bacterium]
MTTVSALLLGACGSSFTSNGDTTGGSSTAGLGNSDSGSAGMSEAGAGSTACANAATDCPATGTNCLEAICLDGSCATSTAPAETACSDHGGSVCDRTGKCVACLIASDCPAPTTACKVNVCKVDTHTCSTAARALGVACKENGGLVCDGAGACVSTHCTDGVLDSDETDVDCGGSCGAKCKDTAPQQKCKIAADCVSGMCSGTPLLCQPPPACAATCAGSCVSCSVPGKLGSCAKLPPGVDDAASVCMINATCDGSGACVSSQSKAHFGDACTQDLDCFNGNCGAGLCKLANGDACAEDAACKSGRCSANVCAACTGDTDCASGKCSSGICLLPGGYSCAATGDCASQSCSFSKACVQAGSEACTAQACITYFCHNGFCQTCSANTDCPLGSACTGGSCRAPAGAYCTKNDTCASGVCAPAALLALRKCQ